MLWSFGIFFVDLVFFPTFEILQQEISGNPDRHAVPKFSPEQLSEETKPTKSLKKNIFFVCYQKSVLRHPVCPVVCVHRPLGLNFVP
jgi:hypothetical protein